MDYSHLRTGFFKGKIIKLNPTFEELTELLGEEPEKQPTYTWTSKGVRKAAFEFYIENTQNEIFKYAMLLSDEKVVSSKGSYQYINCLGDTQWVTDESQLWNSFTEFQKVTKWSTTNGKYAPGAKPVEKETLGKKQYRIASKGEEDLLHIWKLIVSPKIYDVNTNLLLDLEAFFSGDFSQIKLDTDTYHFVAFAYVNNDFKQKIWKRFLPTDIMSELRNKDFSSENRKLYSNWESQAKDEQFGIQGYYNLTSLQVFEENFIKSDKIISDDGPDY